MDYIGVKEFIEWLASTGILAAIIGAIGHGIKRREEARDKKHDEELKADLERRKERQALVDKREKERQDLLDAREAKRDEFLAALMISVDASLELGEATARAVQRIPDAHCNGDMSSALENTEAAKKKKQEFMTRQTIVSIYNNQQN